MSKIWDDQDVSEYEMMAEDAQKAEELAEEYASTPTVVEAEQDELDEISDESAFELTNTESNVVYNARLRLEQAKLYELLINHNLFEGVEASEQAIKNVQNELKFYVVKRLEILLGIREPVVRIQSAQAEPQFDEVELDFLKQLAYKGTFGTPRAEREPVKAAPKAMTLKPVMSSSQKLKAMTNKKVVEKQEVKREQPAPLVRQQAVQARPVEKQPVKKQQPAPEPAAKKAVAAPKVGNSGMGRNLTSEEATAIAKADMLTASNKSFNQMNAKEKAKKIAEVNERHKRPVAPTAIPMPSPDQIKMKYMTQQESRSYSKDQTNQFNSILASTLAARKNRGDYDGE